MSHQETLRTLITINPDILGGEPVFKGTRVPIRTLFEYIQRNYTLKEFLDYFPTVPQDAALKLLGEVEAFTIEQAV